MKKIKIAVIKSMLSYDNYVNIECLKDNKEELQNIRDFIADKIIVKNYKNCLKELSILALQLVLITLYTKEEK